MQTDSDPARDAALAFLYGRIDYERSVSIPYASGELRLDRMRDLLARLGNPQDRFDIIHVAGTKGKGSTSAMIAAILTASGYKTGLYTSPHLHKLEERIRIGGVLCTGAELASLVTRLQPIVAALDSEAGVEQKLPSGPTYFELTTAMALMHFADQQVDAAVLEVGLGGRLDSTNVCAPLVTAITSISFDHMEQLGNTLSAIAYEKAGIVKPGVPLVSGVLADEPRETIAEVCRSRGSELVQRGVDFDGEYQPSAATEDTPGAGNIDFWYQRSGVSLEYRRLALSLLGQHQGANAAVAIAVCIELARQGWRIPEAAVREGLANTRWPARVELIARRPAVVLDTAHNVASIGALIQTLRESFASRQRLLVFATTRGKDIRGMLELLLPAFDQVVFTQYGINPRGAHPEDLQALATELGYPSTIVCRDVPSAWQAARTLAERDDLICITGSFFLAAETRPLIEAEQAYRRVSTPPLRGTDSRGGGAEGFTTTPPSDGGASARGF